MTTFTLRRIGGRVVVSPEPSTTLDIVYLGDLDQAGIVKDTDDTFWCDTQNCGQGVPLKRVSAAQIAAYVVKKLPGGTLAGDVTGAALENTVARVRGRVVTTAAPLDGQVLTWDAGLGQIVWRTVATTGGGSVWDGGTSIWDGGSSVWD